MAVLRRQYVPRTAGDIAGQFTDNIVVSNLTNPIMRVLNPAALAVNATQGTFQFRALDDAGGNANLAALQCKAQDASAGATRADFNMRCQNGSGLQRNLLIAHGLTEDGGGATGMKTKTSAIALVDVPTDCMMCCDDGTDIGIYLNDNGVLKKLDGNGLFV